MTDLKITARDTFRLGIVGDLHTHFDAVDIQQLNRLRYDLLFVTGDLGGGSRESCLAMAGLLSHLKGTVLVMPGNNDLVDIDQLAAELTHRRGVNRILAIAREAEDSGHVKLCGYSLQRIAVGDRHLSLITARPHSMGGPELSFPDYMARSYGVHSIEDSESRLRKLVDQADNEIIFLAHNGPRGLGDRAQDIWGCDFKPDGGDWGDRDLASVIDYADSAGKQVLAVIAGHMHLRTKQGERRPWRVTRDGIVYVNAALVPRIFHDEDDVYRHHVSLEITEATLDFEEVLLAQGD